MSSLLVDQIKTEFYTYAEAAQRLGVCKATLWHWIKAGKFEAYHLGREVLIEKAEVEMVRVSRQSGGS